MLATPAWEVRSSSMAKVYLSSTVLDLRAERDAVTRWLISADHQPVHSYVADGETVRDSCLADIARCDLYVLVLGHRYGYVPERDNPEQLSITHIEFRRAGELGLPRIALMRTSVPDINHSDLLDPVRSQRMQDFHAEVRQSVRPAEFKDEADLIAVLSTAVQRALEERQQAGEDLRAADHEASPRNLPHAGQAERYPRQPADPGTGYTSRPAGAWWTTMPGLLTGAAAVIAAVTGLVTLFVPHKEPPPASSPLSQTASSPPSLPASATGPAQISLAGPEVPVLPKVVLAGPGEVSFEKYRPSTYTVLGIEALPRTPTHYVLDFRVRLLTRSSMDMNFWDSGFRLLIDGLPSAPDSNLNELVAGNATKEGKVSFQVPYGARRLALRVIHHESLGETAELPLRFAAGATAAEGASKAQSVRTGDIGAGAKIDIRQNQ